ncbi:hypothetical protein DACRYDRAFT_22661 [Dacryopinax primogenitus]|uniref:Uncharacterized protein n=1 Tax=Dacryopinax primogenitus (strain DJM 731) TaxID=1858805 RepID=M5GC26_DACPD|nr:uncharacterized protein DACRYDRAFT_22661 [Dacryopinax primogenitus]EJU01583.1 hypothetical protein DACRYDRAFT_22661 [Dacryopinax primogenitus]
MSPQPKRGSSTSLAQAYDTSRLNTPLFLRTSGSRCCGTLCSIASHVTLRLTKHPDQSGPRLHQWQGKSIRGRRNVSDASDRLTPRTLKTTLYESTK